MTTDRTPDEIERARVGLCWLALGPTQAGPSRYQAALDCSLEYSILVQAGVPEGVAVEALSDEIEDSEPMQAARRWAAWERPRETWEAASVAAPRTHGCLVLEGTVGTGKSVAAAWLLLARARAGHTGARWVDCRGLVSSAWDKVHAVADLVSVPALVLDDLSAAVAERDAARTALAALLGRRHECRRLTVITSNLGPAGVAEAVGAAVRDRIGQDGEVVTCTSASLRATRGPSSLPATVRDSQRLVYLVRRLAGEYGHIPAAISDLPTLAAVEQLGRLLGCGWQAAWSAHEASERCRELGLAEMARQTAILDERRREAQSTRCGGDVDTPPHLVLEDEVRIGP